MTHGKGSMAHAEIFFVNPVGKNRNAPVGFSWTVLFFGFFPPLFRQHWVGFLIIFIAAILTCGLSGLVFMFIYNKMYIKHLIEDGYKAKNASVDLSFLQQKIGLIIPRLV